MKTITIILLLYVFLFIFSDNTEAFLNFYPTSFGEAMAGNINTLKYTGAFYFNPANTYIENKWNIVYEHKFLFNNLSHYNSTFLSFVLTNRLYFGFGYINQSISNIPIFGEFPNNPDSVDFTPIGYFSDNANLFLLNINYHYKPNIYDFYTLSGGINIKYVYHSIYDYIGIGNGFDVSANCNIELNKLRYNLKGEFELFIVFKDIGGLDIKWNTPNMTVNSRNMSLSGGIGYNYKWKKFRFYSELNIMYANIPEYGTSFLINYNDMIGIFSGIKYYRDYDNKFTIKKPGVGIELNVMYMKFVYAISKYDLGINHSISAELSL